MNSIHYKLCLVADLKMLSAVESKNSWPVFSGWRPLLRYDGAPEELLFGGITVIFENEKLAPEQTGRVAVELGGKHRCRHVEFAVPNAGFKLMDGPFVRAVGSVIELTTWRESNTC